MNSEGILQAAYYIREGDNVEKNVELAISLYKKVLETDSNNVRALRGLAWCFLDQENMEQNKDVWMPLMLKAANLGDDKSQVVLGEYYVEVPMDFYLAIEWYEKAALQGNVDAMSNIGILIFDERNGLNDYQKGFYWLNKAYEMKQYSAAEELGDAYFYCPDVQYQDKAKAVEFYKEAALKGSDYSAHAVALAYLYGDGVQQDYYEALVWMYFAANHGNTVALNALAAIYSNPKKRNLELSTEDRLAIIEQASDNASIFCFDLMSIYETGKDVRIDSQKADEFCEKFYEVYGEEEYLKEPYGEEEYLKKVDAREHLQVLRNLKHRKYLKAFASWYCTSDSDIEGKLSVIKDFQNNVDEESDLVSLRTLACIYFGMKDIPCYYKDAVKVEGVCINSIDSVNDERIIDFRKAFELLDKGIAWGDEKSVELLETFCRMVEYEHYT